MICNAGGYLLDSAVLAHFAGTLGSNTVLRCCNVQQQLSTPYLAASWMNSNYARLPSQEKEWVVHRTYVIAIGILVVCVLEEGYSQTYCNLFLLPSTA